MTVYFYTRTTRKNSIVPLYFRFNSIPCKIIFKTKFCVNSSMWSNKTKSFKRYHKNNQILMNDLNSFIEEVVKIYNLRREIDKECLDVIQNTFFTPKTESLNYYLLPYLKSNKLEKIGVTERTIQRYKTVFYILLDFEESLKFKLKFESFDKAMYHEFLNYLTTVRKLNNNTIGGYVGVLKLWLKEIDSTENYIVSLDYREFKKPTSEVIDTYLDEIEISKIKDINLSSERLNNAKKWFLIGLHTGLRVSDLLELKSHDFNEGLLKVTMRKTKRTVVIPIHENCKEVISNGFPYKISSQKFNVAIKEICKNAGITDSIKGSKKDEETKRLVVGFFPKYQLISSHTCRRSFATNLYGKLPNKVIMAVTGHKTEQVFEKYIKTTNTSYAKQMEAFWMKKGKED